MQNNTHVRGNNSGRHKCLPQLVKKASQSLPPLAANRVQSVFCRGVYLAENTSQTASVEFVPHWGTNYARSRVPKFVGKARKGFFDSLSLNPWVQAFSYPMGFHKSIKM